VTSFPGKKIYIAYNE